MDSIRLTGVRAQGTHGVFASEHVEPQTFVVDVDMKVDTRAAAASDNVVDTVDYGQIAQRIVHIIQGEHVDLIETLANTLAHAILQSHMVQEVTVTVHKPQAPITVPFDDVMVTVTRKQDPDPATTTLGSLQSAQERAAGSSAQQQSQSPSHSQSSSHSLPQAHLRVQSQSPSQQESDTQQPPVVHHAVIAMGGNTGNVVQTLRGAIVSLDSVPGNQITGISPLYRTPAWGMKPGTPDFYNAVIQVDTTLDAYMLLNTLNTIEATFGRIREQHWADRPIDLDIIDFDGAESSDPTLTLPHPRAWQRAFVLAPWLDLDAHAHLAGQHGGDVAQLVTATPDYAHIQRISRSWILGDHVLDELSSHDTDSHPQE